MNHDIFPPFDAWDTFNDIVATPNPNSDEARSVQNCDDLVAVLMSYSANESTRNWCNPMPVQWTLPVSSSRSQFPVFEHSNIDNTAREMMMTPQLNLQQEFVSNENDSMIGEYDYLVENSTFPWEDEHKGAYPSSNMFSRSPMDNFSPQSSSSNVVELHFQPRAPSPLIPLSACGFGCVEVAHHMSEIQTASTYDADLSPIKKSVKKKRNARPKPTTILPPDPPNMNQWRINDGNGRLRRPLLHEYLRMLLNDRQNEKLARYVDRRNGVFKFYERETVAQLWGMIKGRNGSSKMTYDKFARGIRYYYKTEEICPYPGRFTFRFGPSSGIILAFTKRNPIEIAQAIRNFYIEATSIELIQHLIQYLPSESEIDVFRSLPTDKEEELSPTDRLMYEIIQIPFYMERLNTLKFQLTFSNNCALLNDQIQLVNEACNFLYQSKDIQKLLEIVLSVLNHLNSTPTYRTLTLDELSKVHDLKASKSRMPIMNIVSQICNDRHPEIFDLKQNYQLIFSASKIELTMIKSEMNQLKQQAEQVQLWIKEFEERNSLEEFLLTSRETLDKLFRFYQTTNDQFEKTISYFTKESTTSTVFLSIFANLIQSLQNRQKKN